MAKQIMTRIGIIRAAIVAAGGVGDVVYYADNTRGMSSGFPWSEKEKDAGDAVYKIDKRTDGLNVVQRVAVMNELNKHPDVKRAYISRQYEGGGEHLKVVFDGISPAVQQATRKKRRKDRARWNY